MTTLTDFCKKEYGQKLYKLSLSGPFTCPNRDGKVGFGGCIFCSEGGSGDFSASKNLPLAQQIEEAKSRISEKYRGDKYIAYFQSFTNTYAPAEFLKEFYDPVARRDDIAVISIATRPDCLPEEVLDYLGELRKQKPLWVELGLQTVHPKSAEYIRRGYETALYDRAVECLNAMDIHTVTHVILGLPGETEEDMLATVRHVAEMKSGGIKLQLLHVLRGTDLAKDYAEGKFRTLEEEEYLRILCDCLQILPPETVVHRMTGDGPKKLLIAPLWSANKRQVLNTLQKKLKEEALV